jgi:RimJ/RimL family protein N-acetyltransferase
VARRSIRTERLRLRSWRMSDARRYQRACNTPAVMRWIGGVQTARQVRDDIAYFMASEAKNGFTYWVVERLSDGAFLGFVGLDRIPEQDCPFRGEVEVGWRLRESVWRKGFGFEAASAVLELAFSEFDVSRVVSRTEKGNKASNALMRKLGLKRRRAMDYAPSGFRSKFAVYSITAAQWRKHSKKANS